MLVGGRPRKTQEELDQEMDDYFGTKEDAGGATVNGETKLEGASQGGDQDDVDIDMIS